MITENKKFIKNETVKSFMKHYKIWDILAYAVLAGILLWLILKATGVINTPVLIEYSPFFGAVYLAGWAMNKLDRTTKDVDVMKQDLKALEKNVNSIEIDFNIIRKNCPKLAKR